MAVKRIDWHTNINDMTKGEVLFDIIKSKGFGKENAVTVKKASSEESFETKDIYESIIIRATKLYDELVDRGIIVETSPSEYKAKQDKLAKEEQDKYDKLLEAIKGSK